MPSLHIVRRSYYDFSLDAGKSAPRRALITGGSRGIGLAIAHSFAARNIECTLIGRNEKALESAVSGLAVYKPSASCVVGDVSDQSFWKDADIKSRKFDILVNAAGISYSALLVRTSENRIDNVVQTNLMGTMWACRTVGKCMLRNEGDAHGLGKGCIINVASLLGVQGGAGVAAYAASKAGVVGLTRALAAELGAGGVRVNAILPGYIETDMTAAMTPTAREKALERIPLKRFGNADEVADAAVFLATNAYANNCVLNLDGGLSAT